MKVRKTGYPNPYAGVAAPSPSGPAQGLGEIARVGTAGAVRAPDEATVLGIPASDLTPKVREAIDQLMAEVQHLREELERARRRVDHLEHLADQDALTPVLNRRAFVRELSRIMAFSERYGASSAILYFDVNGLKDINDRHGHAAGDAVITHVAKVLMANVRSSDVVGRLGGDEFGVILAQAGGDEAAAKGRSLSDAIEGSALEWNGIELRIRASYGVHSLAAGQEAHEALDAADRAMYAQKHGRKTPADEA